MEVAFDIVPLVIVEFNPELMLELEERLVEVFEPDVIVVELELEVFVELEVIVVEVFVEFNPEIFEL